MNKFDVEREIVLPQTNIFVTAVSFRLCRPISSVRGVPAGYSREQCRLSLLGSLHQLAYHLR